MIILAKRAEAIPPSATIKLNDEVIRLTQEGNRILGLAIGEPDFETPEHIKDAAIMAIHAGKTRYTPVNGVKGLRVAIQKKYQASHGIPYIDGEITLGNGAKQVIFNALYASLDPCDEVVLPVPYWTSYPDVIQMCQGVPVYCKKIGRAHV